MAASRQSLMMWKAASEYKHKWCEMLVDRDEKVLTGVSSLVLEGFMHFQADPQFSHAEEI